jgi:hypothetical protein
VLCHCKNYPAPPATIAEIDERCLKAAEISQTLDEAVSDFVKWMSVYQCRVCGRYWAMEYPFGHIRGAGRKCFYAIDCLDPVEWLKQCKKLPF